jgi:hypothetical protein
MKRAHRQALTMIGDSPEGVTASILLAQGFDHQVQGELVGSALARNHSMRIAVGDRAVEVTLIVITEAGKQALARRPQDGDVARWDSQVYAIA